MLLIILAHLKMTNHRINSEGKSELGNIKIRKVPEFVAFRYIHFFKVCQELFLDV